MQTLIQYLPILAAIMLTGLGVMSMFAPRKMVSNFAIEPVGIQGLSTLRSVIGGLFLAAVAMIVLGLIGSNAIWLQAAAILLGAVALGRVVSLAADGFDKSVIPPLIVELVIITILLVASGQFASA